MTWRLVLIVVPANRTPAAEVEVSAGGAGGSGVRVDDALRARAKGWALNLAMVFLAHSEDNVVLREIGRRTLSAVLATGLAGTG